MRREHDVKRLFSCLLSVAFLAFAALAQEPAKDTVPAYALRDVSFDIKGASRPWALKRAAGIEGDETFRDADGLQAWLSDVRRKLTNQRVLKTVTVDASYGDADASGTVPVDLAIRVEDTWNVIALPKPQYDSNDGFEMTIKARDYNFLGTLKPLKFDFGYSLKPADFHAGEFSKGAFFVEIDSDTPLRAFGRDWVLDFDHRFSYTYEQPLYYRNLTGLSLEVPLRLTSLSFFARQGYILNEENEEERRPADGRYFSEGWYLSSEIGADWRIPTGVQVDGLGDLVYVPRASFGTKYRPGADIGDARRGPELVLGHSLSFGRIDWIGNFRRGLEVSLGNSNKYNLSSSAWEKEVVFIATGHLPIADVLGVSSRLEAAWYLDKTAKDRGDVLRGILNDRVSADRGLFLNLDFPVRVIRFAPSEWFGKSWLGLFDFEQQWTPFLDVALVDDPVNGRSISFGDGLVSGGVEVVTFPAVMRSIYIRVSAGFDLRAAAAEGGLPGNGGREFFIGLGHHY